MCQKMPHRAIYGATQTRHGCFFHMTDLLLYYVFFACRGCQCSGWRSTADRMRPKVAHGCARSPCLGEQRECSGCRRVARCLKWCQRRSDIWQAQSGSGGAFLCPAVKPLLPGPPWRRLTDDLPRPMAEGARLGAAGSTPDLTLPTKGNPGRRPNQSGHVSTCSQTLRQPS